MVATVGALRIELSASVARFAKDLRKVSFRLRRFGRQAGNMGRSLTAGITLPLAGIGAGAFKMSTDFSSALTKMQSLVGVSRKQIDAWRGDILKLGGETGRAPRELADAMFFITSAGLRGAAALDTLKASAQAAAAGLGATEVIADAVTSAINKYGAENLSAAKATGILVAAVREGKVSAEALAPVLGQLLPLAQNLGVGFDQVAAAIAATSRGGLDAAKSAVALKGILKALLKPAEGTVKVFKKFETSIEKVRKQVREEGLLAALTTLKEKFGDNQEAMTKIFPDIEGLVGVLSLLGGGAGETKRIFAELAAETGGSLAKAFAIAKENDPSLKLAQSTAALSGAMIKLGDVLTPVIIPAIQKLTELVIGASEWFGALGPDVQEASVMIAGAFAAGGPALIAVGFFAKAIGALVAAAGPIGLFIAAAAAVVVVFRNWDTIGPIAKKTVEAVMTWMVTKFRDVVDGVKENVDKIVGFFKGMWEKVVGGSFVPAMILGIEKNFARLGKVMVEPARKAARAVTGAFKDMGEDAPAKLGQFTEDQKEGIATVREGIDSISSSLGAAVSGVVLYGKTWSQTAKGIGLSLAEGLINSLVKAGTAMASNFILARTFGVATAAAAVAEGATVATAWAPAAALAALATLGANAAPASAALTSTVALSHGLALFAKGGVTNSPAIFGEGPGREAAVPLPDGRRIPVDLRGGGSDGSDSGPVTVNFFITTLDARGFEDMLQENRATITNIVRDAQQNDFSAAA